MKSRPIPATHRALVVPTEAAASVVAILAALEGAPKFNPQAEALCIQASGADVRITFDGTAPTAEVGFLLRQTDRPKMISRGEADLAKVIAVSGTPSLQISEYFEA